MNSTMYELDLICSVIFFGIKTVQWVWLIFDKVTKLYLAFLVSNFVQALILCVVKCH